MDHLLHNVDQLPAAARSAVEALIGHPLRDDQQLYIMALEKGVEPSVEVRRQAWEELQQIVGEIRANVQRSGASTDEVEKAIDEECEIVRYGKKPCA